MRYGLFFSVLIFAVRMPGHAGASLMELEPIVVSKQKAHLFNSYSISPSPLNDCAGSSLLGRLQSLPVDLQSRSPQAGIQSDFSLRGSTFQQVVVALDGQRINDPQTAHHNSDIPLTQEDIDKVEVIPGAGSALYGSDAIGGALNFSLKKPAQRRLVIKTSMGEYGRKAALVSVTEKKGGLGVRVSFEKQKSAGFRPGTEYDMWTGSMYSRYDLPWGIYEASYGHQQKEFGAYDFYSPGSGYQSQERTRTGLLSTGFDLRMDELRIKPGFIWRRHYDTFALDKTQVRSRYLNHHRTDTLTPVLYLQKDMAWVGKAGLGLEYGQERINSTGLGKHQRDHLSVYFDDSKELSEWFVLGASLRADDYSGFDRAYTGSSTFKYAFSRKHSLAAGISKSTRMPSFTELYYNDPTTLGDESLSAEEALNYQLGYEYAGSRMSAGALVFYRDEEKGIDWIKRSPAQLKWQVENMTRAQVYGLENYARFKLTEIARLDCAYTYTNKRLNGQGFLYKYGPNYARHLLTAGYSVDLPCGTQSIGATYKQKTGRRGWFLLHLRLSRILHKNVQLFAEANNLLNVEYQEIEGIPQPGRQGEAGVRFEW